MRGGNRLWLVAILMVACGGGSGSGDVLTDAPGDGILADLPGADTIDTGVDVAREIPPVQDVAADDAPVPADTVPEVVADVPADVEPDAVPDVVPDVPPVCTATCGECQACQGSQCIDHVVAGETEGASEKGRNDSFDTAEVLALGVTATGHIGADGDQDWYRFCATAVGVVTLTVDFKASYDALGIQDMTAPVYTESWLPSLVAIALSDDTKTACVDEGTTMQICKTSMTVKFSVTPVVGAYTFYLSGSGDGEVFPGFDAANPYTLTLSFAPGDTLETDQPAAGGVTVGTADTWDTAFPLSFDDAGKAVATSYTWFWNDVDWFKLHVPADGWLRISEDVSAIDDHDDTTFLIQLDGSVMQITATGPQDPGGSEVSFTAGDSPNCPWTVNEFTGIPAGDYYLRLSGSPGAKVAPYLVTIEFKPGAPEDDQPDLGGKHVGAAEDSTTAYDLGTLAAGGSTSVQSYFWHYFDEDWYKVRTPAAGGTLQVDLDFQAAYDAIGWTTGCEAKPGLQVWMYLFEESDLSFPGVAQGYDDNVPKQSITFAAKPDTTYYVAIMSRNGWDPDHPYTLTTALGAK